MKPTTIRALAEIGGLFYAAVMGTELTLVLLAAPAATAGAICIDRARGTLTHLLVTDLNDAEIVLGKLAARLLPVIGLVVCGLPVMALLVLLGGVDPDALLGAFLVTVGVALLGSTLALVFSLWVGKTHEALLGTYAVWGLWLLGRPILRQLDLAFSLGFPTPPWTLDPIYLVLAPYWWPGQVGRDDYLTFLGVTAAISSGLVALAVWRLRAVCTRQNVKTRRRSLFRLVPGAVEIGCRLTAARCWIGPPLDLNPVFWREWHRNRPSRWARVVTGLYVVLAVTFTVISMRDGSGMLGAVVNGFQVSFGLLLLSVTSATSLAEERVRGSLDVLMATPLSTRQIVLGKWLGSFRMVPALAILPCLVILLGPNNGKVSLLPGAIAMLAYVMACGAAVTSLGLAMATWCTRLGRAVGLTVTGFVAMTVGWMFLVMALSQPSPVGFAFITGSPFYGPLITTAVANSSRNFNNDASLTWTALWAFLYSGAALSLLIATLASFNRCMGRVENGLVELGRWKPEPVALVRIEPKAGPEFAEL
jgi:ABC-type transport system involved in multi-copper enzyme maturation permease subunit